MALTDEHLLDFDEDELANYDREEALRALAEHGDAFRYQLVAARHLDGWADRVERGASTSPEGDAAFVRALREVGAHLRQGDYLPGGEFYKLESGDG